MWAYVYTCPKVLPFYGFLLFVLHLPFFIIFRLFPSMALIENISFAENIFHLKNFGTWLPVAMCVAGVYGSMSVRIYVFVHMPWYIGTHGVCTFLFSRICSSLFVQIFNACALIPKFPCLRSYYGFCAPLATAEGPLDICSLVVYLVFQYFTR